MSKKKRTRSEVEVEERLDEILRAMHEDGPVGYCRRGTHLIVVSRDTARKECPECGELPKCEGEFEKHKVERAGYCATCDVDDLCLDKCVVACYKCNSWSCYSCATRVANTVDHYLCGRCNI